VGRNYVGDGSVRVIEGGSRVNLEVSRNLRIRVGASGNDLIGGGSRRNNGCGSNNRLVVPRFEQWVWFPDRHGLVCVCICVCVWARRWFNDLLRLRSRELLDRHGLVCVWLLLARRLRF
jgi:hypothetical protein